MDLKRISAGVLSAALCLSLCACGGGGSSSTPAETGSQGTTPVTTAPVATTPVPEETEPAAPSATPVEVGGSITTDNFVMTFDSLELLPEYSYATSEYSSTSLYVEEGYQLLVVKGTFENVGTTVISDSCFSLTATVNDEYVVDGYDVRLNFERDKYFEVDPYTEQAYNLYINIPDKLAEMFETASFTIGFKDDMSVPTTTYGSDGSVTVDIDQQYVFTSGLTNAG